jgi:autotransporter-associated beta strand protein
MVTTRWQNTNSTGGLWGALPNWTVGIPNGQGDFVTFDITDVVFNGSGAGTRAIDLGGVARTVGFLNLFGDATRNWHIGTSLDTVILQPNGGDAFVSGGGSLFNVIFATLQLNAGADFFVDSGSNLVINNTTESGGARGIEKFGTGNLQLVGNSGYTGTTQIHAGGLGVGSGGTTGSLGSGDVIVDAGALLTFFRTDTTTINNQISGGGFVAAQTGTTTLTNANTWTGGLAVDVGATLIAGNTLAFGTTGNIRVLATGTLDMNGFDLAGYDTGALFDRIVAGGTTGTITSTFAFSQDLTAATLTDTVFNGSLTGNLNLIKTGVGALYLTGQNSLSTIVGSGLLLQDGSVALLGAASYYDVINTSGSGTFDISGISGASTTIQSTNSTGLQGGFILGGKELVADLTFGSNTANIISTFGLQDKLVLKQAAGSTGTINAGVNFRFLNWEDSFDTITIMGNDLDNTLTGSSYSDIIYGGRDGLGTGLDTLDGGLGDDQLFGGAGNDKLTGGLGNDVLNGGADNDTVSYEFAARSGNGIGVTVSLLTQGVAQNTNFVGLDTLIDIENITGSRNGDTLTGDANVNIIMGLGGNDTIQGGAGGDTLNGGTGIDTLSYASSTFGVTINLGANTASGGDASSDTISLFENVTGSNAADTINGTSFANVIIGGGGADNMRGGAGNDVINGGTGSDIIWGGDGRDNLTGGTGNDVFFYSLPPEGGDIITDFSPSAVGNNDKFRFTGSAFGALPVGTLAANRFDANLSGLANTLDQRFIYETDTGLLRYDADGSDVGLAVVIANVLGAPVIDLTDFQIV